MSTDTLDVARIRPPQSVLGLLPPRVARGLGALPVAVGPDGSATVCVADATDFALRDRLERLLEGRAVRFAEPSDPAAFAAALRENYPDAALNGTLDRPEELFAYMLRRALARGASDIHVSPDERGARIRLRVDGRLVTDRREPPEAAAEFVSYIKVLAKLDIAERRAPQDGNIDTELDGATVALRVATVPTLYGEHVTLRLLSQTARTQRLERLEDLGMHPEAFALFRKALRAPNGVIIISGPTGSGKTTTLYAALRALAASDDRHLVSIEDPVEKPVAGVTQIKVDGRQERVSFAKALRSVLRHDPDVVMVGEVRDGETAATALRSALTGHLVLTTLHTNSAPAILTRLTDLGVPPYLVAGTLRLAMAQRLVRRPCPACVDWAPATPEECAACGWDATRPPKIPHAKGCPYCGGTGYAGRTAVYEMLPVDDAARDALMAGRPPTIADPALTLRGDGLRKVLEGETTLDEIADVIDNELLT